jgi:hypothetical protein
MKKLIIAMMMMTAILSGCDDKVYYEYCDEWGNCVWSQTPPDYALEPSPVIYVVEETPTSTSHSHSEDTYVYYDDSHNHTEVIIVEDNGYDPYYYEFHNNFQEFCYGEGTPYHTTTCWQEWCYDHWLGGGWYVWDEWCE